MFGVDLVKLKRGKRTEVSCLKIKCNTGDGESSVFISFFLWMVYLFG